ncbi:MAG: ABC transporter ATP-binding protein [Algicola sp.]|nr:ABC transporter ATP-binding protein [Algicola sp.]
MINIQSLEYNYSKKINIFKNINLQFSSGKIYGLLGKNGVGKSTLIKNITGMLFPTKGSCEVFGLTPGKREVEFLQDLFFVPEEYYLPNLTIKELISIYKDFYPNFDVDQFDAYVKEFKISKDKKTTELSLGQKKKILIGFALSANTKVLIMDEPTNGLDIPSKITFRNIIKDAFKKDRIVIITSHQVRDLDELIDAIIIMHDGQILLNQDKDAIAKKLQFKLSDNEKNDAAILYQEKVSNGFASIQKNTSDKLGYVDIELLFNAVLANKLKL